MSLSSYLRDTGDFIEQLSKIDVNLNAPQTFLTKMDVVSLCMNIPHDKGIIAMQYLLNLRTERILFTQILFTTNTIYKSKGQLWAMNLS